MKKYYHTNSRTLAILACVAAYSLLATGCSKSGAGWSRVPNNVAVEKTVQFSSYGLSKGQSYSQFIVDQTDTTLIQKNTYNIHYFEPMGQEFIPDFHALDAIELQLDDASCYLEGSPGGNLMVRVRESTIGGTIIGTSDTMHFDNCFVGNIRFDFPSFIPLIPGRTYVLEAVYISLNTCTISMDEGPSSLYNRGSLIMSGIVQPGKDMWFREGLDHSVARYMEQAKDGGWQKLVRADGTTFKSQGDCIQYINTGK